VTLAQLVHQISTDSAFAAAFRAQPRLQLATVGATLTEDETLALFRALETQKERGHSVSSPDQWPAWWADQF
jgi:hypothetical protein